MNHSNPSVHFLQSPAWQRFQQALGRRTITKSGPGWSYLAILEPGRANSRLYCPFGPTYRDPAALAAALRSLTELGRQLGVTFLRIGPIAPAANQSLSADGWRPVTYLQLQPEHTSLIDTTLPTEQLVAQMAQPVRNCYRNYHKKGLQVHRSHQPADIDIFLELIHQVAQRTGMRPHADSYFRTQADSLLPDQSASLYYVTLQDQPLAAALFYDTATQRIYAHAAASMAPEYRKLNASTALLASAIVDAQQAGQQSVDLYGIAADDAPANHPWAGFTKFKRSFGGQDVDSGQSWDLPLRPLAYWSYRAYQALRR